MLRIYGVILEMLVLLRPVLEEIGHKDRELEDQGRRASQSVLLNAAEGSAGIGRSRVARYATSLGSMRETRACLDVALAFGYIGPLAPELHDKIEQITGTLVVLTAPMRRVG